jgi:hypothetical protein
MIIIVAAWYIADRNTIFVVCTGSADITTVSRTVGAKSCGSAAAIGPAHEVRGRGGLRRADAQVVLGVKKRKEGYEQERDTESLSENHFAWRLLFE